MIARSIATGVLISLATTSTAFGQANVIKIDGAFEANDLTPDGQIVVGGSGSGAYYWTLEDGMTLIGGLRAVAVSDDGSVIFGDIEDPENPGHEVAAIWTSESGWQSLGGFPSGGLCPSRSSAYELSADGTVAVGLGWQNGCAAYAFRWTAQTGLVAMEHLANGGNRASVVSADGTFLGGFAQGNFNRTPAVWYADGSGELLDPSGDTVGEVHGMSDDGTILLGTWDGEAFIWTEEQGVVTFGSLTPGWTGIPTDISDNGTIVGFDFNFGARKAWIRPPGEEITALRDYLIAQGATNVPLLEVAQTISTNGRVICGHTFGVPAWVAYLPAPPCPADLDGNGTVDAADLAALLGAWGPNPGDPADLNDDGLVDAADLALLLGDWGPC